MMTYIKSIFLILVLIFVVPLPASALEFSVPCQNVTDLAQCVVSIYKFALAMVGIVALVIFILGGMEYLLAAGNITKAEKGRERIQSAILGIIILFASYIILYTINPDLVGGKFTLPGISTKEEMEGLKPGVSQPEKTKTDKPQPKQPSSPKPEQPVTALEKPNIKIKAIGGDGTEKYPIPISNDNNTFLLDISSPNPKQTINIKIKTQSGNQVHQWFCLGCEDPKILKPVIIVAGYNIWPVDQLKKMVLQVFLTYPNQESSKDIIIWLVKKSI